ncbi:MAG: ABC transporter permease [Brevinema sp.]
MINIIHLGIIVAIPTLFAALGGIYTEKSKVFNIALEGILLFSAFAAVCGSYYFSSWQMGIVYAVVSSLLIGCFFIFMVLILKINVFITGLLINLLALGGTTFLLRLLFNTRGAFQSEQIQALPVISLPFLSSIPYIGALFSKYHILVYGGIISAVFVYIHIFETPFGLRLRAIGINNTAAQSGGLSVFRIKAIAILFSSFFCGLGGAALSLGFVSLFTENMSNGRGWIALSSLILTRANPLHTLFIVLLFGIFDGASFTLQKYRIPSEFASMLPYIITLITLAFYSKKHKISYSGYVQEL